MLYLRKPSPAALGRFLERQAGRDVTYPPAGALAGAPPPGYVRNHTRVRLGKGREVFAAARRALERWQQFRLGWAEVWPPDTPIRPGAAVAVLARALGLWWLNACRIVRVVDEAGPTSKFGFVYATLPDHAATGEEQFLVEWSRHEGAVWYDLLAVSRPGHWLARLGYPYLRRVQKRFGRDSAAAMMRAAAAASTAGLTGSS